MNLFVALSAADMFNSSPFSQIKKRSYLMGFFKKYE
ncbi:protein of unknown function [Serratia sp. Tan611]|nr:protein of unknown function [Serratia sp. Tan611]